MVPAGSSLSNETASNSATGDQVFNIGSGGGTGGFNPFEQQSNNNYLLAGVVLAGLGIIAFMVKRK